MRRSPSRSGNLTDGMTIAHVERSVGIVADMEFISELLKKPLDILKGLWHYVVLKREVYHMKILEDLYYGNIIPQEKTFIDDSRYDTLLNYVQRHENTLLSEMTETQKETFEKYHDCKEEMQSIGEVNAFISGFKLAMRIMIEVMDTSDNTEIT